MRIVLLVFFWFGISFANGFIDALTNGEKEGDINLLFDYTHSKPHEQKSKYQTGGFLATTFGLYYKSAFYEYFRLHLGFRGALPLWEQHKKNEYLGGRGVAARDFWDNDKAMIARSYLEYFDGDTSIKAGRIEKETDMLINHFDGVWISNKSLGYLLIDAIYMNQYGKVLDRELRGFEKIKRYENNNIKGNSKAGGAYYLGLTFEVLNWLKVKAYGFSSPNIYSFVGGKVQIDSGFLNASAGIIGGLEHKYSEFNTIDKNNEGSYLANADVGLNFDTEYGRFYGNVGYINTSFNNGIGSLQVGGNSVNPFFYWSGDALNLARNLHLVWGKIGYSINFLDIYLVYGFNYFRTTNKTFKSHDTKKYKQGEVNLYFDWRINPITGFIVYFLNTHKSKEAIPNLTQVGVMFKVNL